MVYMHDMHVEWAAVRRSLDMADLVMLTVCD